MTNIQSKFYDALYSAVESEVKHVVDNIGDYVDITDYIDKNEIAISICDMYSSDIEHAIDEVVSDVICDL